MDAEKNLRDLRNRLERNKKKTNLPNLFKYGMGDSSLENTINVGSAESLTKKHIDLEKRIAEIEEKNLYIEALTEKQLRMAKKVDELRRSKNIVWKIINLTTKISKSVNITFNAFFINNFNCGWAIFNFSNSLNKLFT